MTFASPYSKQTVQVSVEHQGKFVMGWAGLFAAVGPGWMLPGTYSRRMYDRLGLALAVLLGGCATAFPTEVMRTVDTRVTAEELRSDALAHKDERVIVGGEILATRPRPGETEIELLGRRFRRDDSPERSDRSPGRLLLRSLDFLDPAVYAADRRARNDVRRS